MLLQSQDLPSCSGCAQSKPRLSAEVYFICRCTSASREHIGMLLLSQDLPSCFGCAQRKPRLSAEVYFICRCTSASREHIAYRNALAVARPSVLLRLCSTQTSPIGGSLFYMQVHFCKRRTYRNALAVARPSVLLWLCSTQTSPNGGSLFYI